jgi:hypothetical protein
VHGVLPDPVVDGIEPLATRLKRAFFNDLARGRFARQKIVSAFFARAHNLRAWFAR